MPIPSIIIPKYLPISLSVQQSYASLPDDMEWLTNIWKTYPSLLCHLPNVPLVLFSFNLELSYLPIYICSQPICPSRVCSDVTSSKMPPSPILPHINICSFSAFHQCFAFNYKSYNVLLFSPSRHNFVKSGPHLLNVRSKKGQLNNMPCI